MAKRIAISCFLLVFTACLSQATAFLPYKGRYGDLWDAMVDPFKVLDQIPDSLTKEVDALALARTNWKETPEAHVFTFDVPGMKKDEIKIEVVENRILTISGQRVKEEEKEGDKWHRVERAAGKFWRQFRLPGNVDMDNIRANLDNGVLTVSVTKLNDDKAKTVKIVDIEETGNGKAVE